MRIVAHRGVSALAPENTLEAFERAISEGADAIETDLRLTQGGAIFCLHDATLARTFGDPRALTELSTAEASALGVPSLAELLALSSGRIDLLLEIKEDAVVEPLANALADADTANVILQAFSKACVRALAEALPQLPRWQLTSNFDDLAPESLDEIARYAQGVAAHFSLLSEEIVTLLRARNLAVAAWTVNEPAERARLQALGIDALITDALFSRSAPPRR